MSNDLNEAKEAVFRFARAWTEWEILMAQNEESLRDPALREARAKLIQEHCTPKKRANLDGPMSFREPPRYDGVVEANLMYTELASPGKAFVDFNASWSYYRFIVMNKGGVWKIDSIKWKVIPTDNWKSDLVG